MYQWIGVSYAFVLMVGRVKQCHWFPRCLFPARYQDWLYKVYERNGRGTCFVVDCKLCGKTSNGLNFHIVFCSVTCVYSRLVVKYTPTSGQQTSFVSVPPSLAARILESDCLLPCVLSIRVHRAAGLPPSSPVYASWAGSSGESGVLGIDPRVGRLLQVPHGSTVTLDVLPDSLNAYSVTVEPLSTDDWEVLELNANDLEERLLEQTGVASVACPLGIWLNGQPVALRVTSTSPEREVVRLVPGTEIYIAPRPRDSSKGRYLAKTTADRNKELNNSPSSIRTGFMQFRVQTITEQSASLNPSQIQEKNSTNVSSAFVSDIKTNVLEVWMNPAVLASASLTAGMVLELQVPKQENSYLGVIKASSITALGHVGFNTSTCSLLKIDQGSTILVRKLQSKDSESSNYEAIASTEDSMPQSSIMDADLIYENGNTYGLEQDSFFQNNFKIIDKEAASKVLFKIIPILAARPRKLLQSWGSPRPGGVLLEGPSGSGKTCLVHLISKLLRFHKECLSHIEVIDCSKFKNHKEAKHVIAAKYVEATSCMPSLLVFDDIDLLCPASDGETMTNHHQNMHDSITTLLCYLLDSVRKPKHSWVPTGCNVGDSGCGAWPPLAILSTCKDASNVASTLREVGRLDTVIALSSPSIENRADILASSIDARGISADVSVLTSVAAKADGFDGSDLDLLIDRSIALAHSRNILKGSLSGNKKDKLHLTSEDLFDSLNGMIPAVLWGSKAQAKIQSGVEGWQDVGGLSDVREALQESIELPLLYPELTSAAPLRLRSGVLLYGPPGCGKTHIVAAAVAATGVRCITVSGPELLNKYIGASEAAVRDVFRRAAAAAPTVLFFDEFDAIAPQRGHDNTGVSDRVVNQLLTELDGVEGLRGVCVIAATSRPDLIDAALLRPGRLDRLMHCNFPSVGEREDILKALSRQMSLADDIDFYELAVETEGWSGADLGSMLAEAQLIAVHEQLNEKATGTHLGKIAGNDGTRISFHHLWKALKLSRSSLSETERQRLEKIYRHFSLKGPTKVDELPKKVTWA